MTSFMELKSNPIGESAVWLASLIASPIRMCVADAAPGLIRFGRSLILVIPHTRQPHCGGLTSRHPVTLLAIFIFLGLIQKLQTQKGGRTGLKL